MEPSLLSTTDEMRVCGSCGSWLRSDRADCPWCGAEQPALSTAAAAVPAEAAPTAAMPLPAPLDDEAEAEAEAAPTPAPLPQPPAGRGRRYWLRAFGAATLFALAVLLAFSSVGAYQGWQDRKLDNKQAAIEHFESAQQLLDEKRYDLAIANLREAVRLEPNFEAAAQLLVLAEQRASQSVAPQVDETPLATTPVVNDDAERLFAEALAALGRDDWEIAAATFDLLHSQANSFRSEEVRAGLLRARREAGQAALDEGDLERALRHFDHVLALEPDDAGVLTLRQLSSAYRTGLRAFERDNWTVAADQFRTVYLIDPSFLDVTPRLAQSHAALGDEFEEREIWCEAAQQFRASVAVVPNSQLSSRASRTEARCSTRVSVVPPTLGPTRTPAATEARAIVPTVALSSTRVLLSVTVTPIGTPIATPIGTPIGTATLALSATPSPRPTVTRSATPSGFAFQALRVAESFDESCGGHYIRGVIRAPDGAPLPNVTVLATDTFGNRLIATSKQEPLGAYDIPISAQANSYRVMVVSGDNIISPVVTVTHDERFVQAPQACHIVEWQQQP